MRGNRSKKITKIKLKQEHVLGGVPRFARARTKFATKIQKNNNFFPAIAFPILKLPQTRDLQLDLKTGISTSLAVHLSLKKLLRALP